MGILDDLKAMEDNLRGIKAPNGSQNGHNFHKGESRKKAIEKAKRRQNGEADESR